MYHKLLIAGLALAGGSLAAAPALAANGYATGNVNMRTGPGTSYAKITTIPAGAPVTIYDCPSWCNVAWAGRRGWVSSNYVEGGLPQARIYVPPRQVYVAPTVRFGLSFGDRDRRRFDRDRWDRWERWDRRDNDGYWRDRNRRNDGGFWLDRN